MDKRLIGLKLLMDHLHIDVDRWEHRKALQFSIHLLQRLGLDLGYHYGWPYSFPYCPELTRDAFWVTEPGSLVGDVVHDYELGPRALESLQKLRDLVYSKRPRHVDRLEWLEILASISFLTEMPSDPKDFDSVFKELTERREDLKSKEDTVHKAWEALHEVGVV